MASISSRSGLPIRDRDKAVQGGRGGGGAPGRDITEGLIHSSRTPRRSNRFKPEPQPIIFNFNGDVQITKGTMFGRSPDEEIEQLRRSRPALPTTPNALGETAPQRTRPRRIIAVEDEEAEAEFEESGSDRDYTWEGEPSRPPLASRTRATPTSAQRVQTWEDSGYSGSTRGSRREKNEVYRASLSTGSSDGLAEDQSLHSKRKAKPASVESNLEKGAASEDNETQLATQGDDGGGNEDDTDDDFERRLMKAATHDNNQVDVHVILDTGTKPDWISSRFLTEKLGIKYMRLSEEENKEFSDFNGNKFNPIGRVELMVNSTDFTGFPCRMISFLVAKGGHFQILLGSRTIKKENLFCKPLDPQMEGVFPAVQTDPKKAERAIIVQNKDKQKREGAERDRLREEARKAKTKEKKESKSSSSSAARLAQESQPPHRRRGKSPSPSSSSSRNAKHPGSKSSKSSWRKNRVPVDERSSSSSLSGGGAAIDD